jgi:hypothetical protein
VYAFKMDMFFVGVVVCLLAGCTPGGLPAEDAAMSREDSGMAMEDAAVMPSDSATGTDAESIAWTSCEISTGVWSLSYVLQAGSDARCSPREAVTVCLCDAAADPARCLHDASLDELTILAAGSACASRPEGPNVDEAVTPACLSETTCWLSRGGSAATLTKASPDSARGIAESGSVLGDLTTLSCAHDLTASLVASSCPDPCADPEYIGVECNLPDDMAYARDEFLCAMSISHDRWFVGTGIETNEYIRDYRDVLYAALNFAQYNGGLSIPPDTLIEFTCGPEGACWFNWSNLDSHHSRCRVSFAADCSEATTECWPPGSDTPIVTIAYYAYELP